MPSEKIKNLERRYKQTRDLKIGETVITTCLQDCKKYRRGTGTYSSSAFKDYLGALGDVVKHETKMEIICSMQNIYNDKKLYDALKNNLTEEQSNKVLQDYSDNIALIVTGCKSTNPYKYYEKLISWLIANGQLEIKFALPLKEHILDDSNRRPEDINYKNMYHFKYGYFEFPDDTKLVIEGSANETNSALYYNGESITLYKSWLEDQAKDVEQLVGWVDEDWLQKNDNFRIYELSDETLEEIKKHSPDKRPGKNDPIPTPDPDPIPTPDPDPIPTPEDDKKKYRHQDKAISAFLKAKNGILDMATGTGKTRTALKIINKLYEQKKIDQFIVTCYGTNLLEQWHEVMLNTEDVDVIKNFPSIYFGKNGRKRFALSPSKSGLITPIDDVKNILNRLNPQELERTLIIYDEVHNLGTANRIEGVAGLNSKLIYRLGLSATPTKGKFAKELTQAIKKEVGPIVYTFGLEDAIKRGILCEFEYTPLTYSLTDDDKKAQKSIHAQAALLKKQGTPMSSEEKAIKLSKIYKLAENKLNIFDDYLKTNPHILKSTIIFVLEEQFGSKVLEILHKYTQNYRTYYGKDDTSILKTFSKGGIDLLVTCNAISQGIDIPTLQNIVLFSSNKVSTSEDNLGEIDGAGETIQRLGRCLRNPKSDKKKIAKVLDFFEEPQDNKKSYDQERKDWLEVLSKEKFQDN